MCGRFTQRYTWREVHDLYGLTGVARNLQAHYNIAPTDTVEVVKPAADGGATELVPMRWGLIPYWWKKPLKQLPATFNARAESVASKAMFRDAFKRHRCIVPASGYYEWLKVPDGKQPYFISATDGGAHASLRHDTDTQQSGCRTREWLHREFARPSQEGSGRCAVTA